jgi:glutamate-ammonia-ligase adenylyltransferase
MDPLATAFVESLRRGKADPGLLAKVGEPEPLRAAAAFEDAAAEPDLAADCAAWAPGLLFGARPGFGAESLSELARRHRSGCGTGLPRTALGSLARLLGGSNFLARLLLRSPELAGDLAGDPPQPPSANPPDAEWNAIRREKYRGLLRIAGRDLAGRPFEQGLAELSDLADRCLEAGLRCAAEEVGVEPPALLALGKLGGRELNFSSDVDLLFVYEGASDTDELERNHEVATLIRHFKKNLENPTAEGFAYRVDLDLRPEGSTGVLANSVSAALDYYETFGSEWERQMLIRLRPVAGPPELAEAFGRGILPFVYRRAIDPEAMRYVRAMKTRIEDERRAARRDLEADLKEGPGGIRDVEFLVQALQLFYAGRHVELRTGNVLEALDEMGRLGILPPETADALREAYLWLRRTEHSVQLVEERQVHAFPRDREEQWALARRMGYRDPQGVRARERLLEDWTTVRSEVRSHFEDLVLGQEP